MITISSTKTHQQCWTHYPAFKCLLNKTVLKNEYSEFLSLPDKTIKCLSKIRQKFFYTLMSLLTFLLVTQTFSSRYFEFYDIPSGMIKTLRYETVSYIYII